MAFMPHSSSPQSTVSGSHRRRRPCPARGQTHTGHAGDARVLPATRPGGVTRSLRRETDSGHHACEPRWSLRAWPSLCSSVSGGSAPPPPGLTVRLNELSPGKLWSIACSPTVVTMTT